VRLGETDRAEQALAALGDQDRDAGVMRISLAALRLAQDNPHPAIAALAPVLDGSAPVPRPGWLAQALLLEAIARDAVGDPAAPRPAPARPPHPTAPGRRTIVVPAAAGDRPARAARPARHRARRADRRHPQPARRT